MGRRVQLDRPGLAVHGRGRALRENQPVARNAPTKVGKLRDAAFDPLLHLTDVNNVTWSTTNPYEWETKIEVLKCPSFAGEDAVAQKAGIFFQTAGINTGSQIAHRQLHLLAVDTFPQDRR